MIHLSHHRFIRYKSPGSSTGHECHLLRGQVPDDDATHDSSGAPLMADPAAAGRCAMVERGDFPWGEISPNLGEQLVLLFFLWHSEFRREIRCGGSKTTAFFGRIWEIQNSTKPVRMAGRVHQFWLFGSRRSVRRWVFQSIQKSPLAIGWFPKSHGSMKLRTAMPLVSSGFPIFRNPLLQLWFDPKNPTCVKSHFFRAKMPFFASKSSAEPAAMSPGPRMLPLLPSWAQPKALEVFRFAHYAFKLGGSDGWVNSLLTGGHVLAKIVGIRKSVLKNAMSARGWTSLDSQRWYPLRMISIILIQNHKIPPIVKQWWAHHLLGYQRNLLRTTFGGFLK